MTSDAKSILRKMEELLAQRYVRRITRKDFLVEWKALRDALALTPEYQAFRLAVIARDGGCCTKCGAATRTVDHIRRVARAPREALQVSNGRLRCENCHAERHACLRKSA